MFESRKIQSKLDAEILSTLAELDKAKDDPKKYDELVERIDKLEKLKPEGIHPSTLNMLLSVGANVFGILWLARYERTEVIKAPNAFRFVFRP